MSRRRLLVTATLTGLALTLGACMSGRASLLATNAPRGTASLEAPGDAPSTSGRGGLLGPSRTSTGSLASSGGAASVGLTGPVQAQANVGGLKLTGGLSTSVASTASLTAPGARASAGAGVSITPALAPAASVGASVAAVGQPLTVVASAKTKTGVKAAAKGLGAHVQTGLGAAGVGASVHLGGG